MSKRSDPDPVLSALARERSPDPALEERTVAELQRRRLLHRPGRPRILVSDRWLATAAAVVVFGLLGAFGAGYWQGSRRSQSASITMRRQSGDHSVNSLLLAGESYQTALADLRHRSAVATPEDRDAIRNATRRTLHPVVEEIVRLTPNDPLAAGILQALDRAETRTDSTSPDSDVREQIVWF